MELKKPVIEKICIYRAFPDSGIFLHHLIPDNPFLVCALDIAAWDLYGKMHKKATLYKCWKLDIAEDGPLTDYTIGIDSIEKMIDENERQAVACYTR